VYPLLVPLGISTLEQPTMKADRESIRQVNDIRMMGGKIAQEVVRDKG
jgi:hypothetical protein